MQYIAYLRDQAEKFRELAATNLDAERARELRELADTCEEIAAEWEADLALVLPELRLGRARRGRRHARRVNDPGRHARRSRADAAHHGDLLQQRAALGEPGGRAEALRQNAGVAQRGPGSVTRS